MARRPFDDAFFKNRIENISSKDFWNSFRPLPALRPALAAGRAGRDAQALQLLGRYHAQSLQGEQTLLDERVKISAATAQAQRQQDEVAARVLRHEITGWHTHTKQFGKRIDFNADFGASGQYGFHYLGWLTPLIHHCVRTGKAKARDGLLEIVEQYYQQRGQLQRRIPHLHPVYYELGACAKIDVLLPVYAWIAGDEAVGPGPREALLKLLLGFGRSLLRLQESGYRPANWQIAGCATLLRLGLAMPEFKESARWRARAGEMLRAHAHRDFFADGGHSERCWSYGAMCLRHLSEAYQTMLLRPDLAGSNLPLWRRFLPKAYRWFVLAAGPHLYQLNYGDGSLHSARSILDECRRLFPDLAGDDGLMGVDRRQSVFLPDSGYAFLRDGRGDDGLFLSVNFGRSGGWHTHSNLLDFTLWGFGQPLIEEVGRFGSYDNPLDPLFRSPQAHNQIVVEHLPMHRPKHQGQDVHCTLGESFDLFSAWHGAWENTRIYRQIVLAKQAGFVLIHDVVWAQEMIFQAANYLHAIAPFESAGKERWRVRGRNSCLVICQGDAPMGRVRTGVDYGREEFPVGKNTGDFERFTRERHHLCFTQWRNVGDARPLHFFTLLAPFQGKAPVAKLEVLPIAGDPTGHAAGARVSLAGKRCTMLFNPTAKKLPAAQAHTIIAARAGSGTWFSLQKS